MLESPLPNYHLADSQEPLLRALTQENCFAEEAVLLSLTYRRVDLSSKRMPHHLCWTDGVLRRHSRSSLLPFLINGLHPRRQHLKKHLRCLNNGPCLEDPSSNPHPRPRCLTIGLHRQSLHPSQHPRYLTTGLLLLRNHKRQRLNRNQRDKRHLCSMDGPQHPKLHSSLRHLFLTSGLYLLQKQTQKRLRPRLRPRQCSINGHHPRRLRRQRLSSQRRQCSTSGLRLSQSLWSKSRKLNQLLCSINGLCQPSLPQKRRLRHRTD